MVGQNFGMKQKQLLDMQLANMQGISGQLSHLQLSRKQEKPFVPTTGKKKRTKGRKNHEILQKSKEDSAKILQEEETSETGNLRAAGMPGGGNPRAAGMPGGNYPKASGISSTKIHQEYKITEGVRRITADKQRLREAVVFAEVLGEPAYKRHRKRRVNRFYGNQSHVD
ncbi:MAG: hypothetical protein MR871_09580 [Lachnospiraceae bacterium]|nr:hypothetical protein [Lachnospiraceae bacterium]